MSRQCPACSKTNPADADYCYYDGRRLSTEGVEGPVHLGTLPFPMPFYFADGQRCANFNQLALACDERWEEAKALLAGGYWPSFFGTIGRLDLAAAAQQAAAEPDADLGLSLLLEKLPADPEALRLPRPALESTEKYLGLLTPGTDRTFELTIINQGMLVLRGMIVSNSDWLVFGGRDGPAQKMFHTRNICNITVRALGNKLRAGNKALEGEIVVDTNGGTIAVIVRADVPIIPFPKGQYANDALAGARSPHEIAVKAKQFPLEAAVLFEQLAVKAWYESNGWIYPVEGSAGTGKGAVQQFFEALGLTKPPVLWIDTASMTFKGRVGAILSQRITLSTEEAKPVFAQVWSNRDWVRIAPIKYQGNKVRIPVEIVVPPQPGETLTAEVIVRGNGKQQFVVPVTLSVEGEREPVLLTLLPGAAGEPGLPAAGAPPAARGGFPIKLIVFLGVAAFGLAALSCLACLLVAFLVGGDKKGPIVITPKKKGSIVITDETRFAHPDNVARPGINRLRVFIRRVDFAGPVTVTLTGLPEGVTVEPMTIRANNDRCPAASVGERAAARLEQDDPGFR